MLLFLKQLLRKIQGRNINGLVKKANQMQCDIDDNIAYNDKAIEDLSKAISVIKDAQDKLQASNVTGVALKKQLSLS